MAWMLLLPLVQGRYISLEVAESLSAFMANDLPDTVRFSKTAVDLIEAAAKAAKGEHPRVAACGESASTLWGQGKADAAVQFEHLRDEIAETYHVDILRGYALTSSHREQDQDVYERICAEHSSVCSEWKRIRDQL
jgi:hypothetical protein